MPAIPNSILDSTKKMLGLDADYDAFDLDIIAHINSTFAQLSQIGVGPKDGFEIEDSSTVWADFIGGNKLLNPVKTYMYLKVRMLFDPPTTSFDLTAKNEQINEIEWRLNVVADRPLITEDGSVYSSGTFIWELEDDNVWPSGAKTGDLGIYQPSGKIWKKS